jgi:tetratricopeptide (TPR) repeat protein
LNDFPPAVSHSAVKSRFLALALAGATFLPGSAAAETLAERTLLDILARQKNVFARAQQEGEDLDEARLRAEIRSLTASYDVLIQKSPDFTLAYVSYADLLGRVGMTREAVAMLFKANKLDPNLPRVKSQIAKHLAEDGKLPEALPWALAAIELAPQEPVYHLNLGLLLAEGRDEFVKTGAFTRAAIDKNMLEAFRRAAELAPDNLAYAYRAAEAYYDLDAPRWDEAAKAWAALEDRAAPGLEKETIRLQAANVLLKSGRPDHARVVLSGVTDVRLEKQKQTLLDQLAATGEK